MILTAINYLVCFVYDLISSDSRKGSALMQVLAAVAWFFWNLFPRAIITFVICEAVEIVASKANQLEALYKMLSTDRLPTFLAKDQNYPVLNIFDVMSLRSWSTLRKVFMHLHEQRLASLTLAVAILMAIQVSILGAIALFHFGILHSATFDFTKYVTFFALDTPLFLITVTVLIFYCVKVNSQFQIDKNLMKTNKGIVINMFRMYPQMVGPQAIKPGSYVYNCGHKVLRKEFGENFSPEQLERRLQALIETYDQIIEDLDYEDIYHPVQLYGVPVRGAFLNSLGVMILTSLTPLIKKFLGF